MDRLAELLTLIWRGYGNVVGENSVVLNYVLSFYVAVSILAKILLSKNEHFHGGGTETEE